MIYLNYIFIVRTTFYTVYTNKCSIIVDNLLNLYKSGAHLMPRFNFSKCCFVCFYFGKYNTRPFERLLYVGRSFIQDKLEMKFFNKNFQNILFVIGLILTIWRSYDCLQKYLYSNLGTKVTMESSFDVVRPSVIICPTYHDSFKIG